jgi:hypothetical protein
MASNMISLGAFDDSAFDCITDANIAAPSAGNVIDLTSVFGGTSPTAARPVAGLRLGF